MNEFTVYEHPVKPPVAVKQGFNYAALFFGLFWLLYKTMWKYSAIFGGLVIASMLLSAAPADRETALILNLVFNLVFLGLWIVVGVYGNDWYRETLESRGYQFKTSTSAQSKDDALARAFAAGDDDDDSGKAVSDRSRMQA